MSINPFYYKGILFSDDTSGIDYAFGVDKINDVCSYIEYGTNIADLRAKNNPFIILVESPISKEQQLIVEISNKGQMFGVYNYVNGSFEDIKMPQLMKIKGFSVDNIQRAIQRYSSAIIKEIIPPKCSAIRPDVQQQWNDRKFGITFQQKIKVFDNTIDADFVVSYQNHIKTPEQLHNAVQNTIKRREEHDYSL